jgi:hypothetical protein
LLECGHHDPSLDFREVPQALRVGFQRVTVDFADRRGQRIEARRDPRRERDVLYAFENALARPVILGAIAEDERYQGQAERALRPYDHEAGGAIELPFQRDGDLLFDFFCRQARGLGDDLRRDIRNVGYASRANWVQE